MDDNLSIFMKCLLAVSVLFSFLITGLVVWANLYPNFCR